MAYLRALNIITYKYFGIHLGTHKSTNNKHVKINSLKGLMPKKIITGYTITINTI